MTTFKIFISHRTDDSPRVLELFNSLKQVLPNFPLVDVSKDIPYSDDWKDHASAMIDSCDAFVCLVGKDTYGSEPVNWEILEAKKMGKSIVIAKLAEEYKIPQACKDLEIKSLMWEKNTVAGKLAELLVPRALFVNHDWSTGEPVSSDIFQQYQIMVESWEALIQRRQTVNTVYLTASTALLAAIGVLVSTIDKLGFTWSLVSIIFLGILGSLLSYNWRRTIISYGLLSKAKARIVTIMETYLWAKLFDTEWGVLEANRYKSTTKTDSNSALLFLLFYLIIVLLATIFLVIK